jgi:chemotaxis protein CheY-P-specific phosphatase CheC
MITYISTSYITVCNIKHVLFDASIIHIVSYIQRTKGHESNVFFLAKWQNDFNQNMNAIIYLKSY